MSRRLPIAQGYLVDLDGTLIAGRHALPGATWLLQRLAGRFAIVSNNAEHTPQELARLLLRLHLPVQPDRLVLAGTTAIDIIAERHSRARLYLIGSLSLRRYAMARGLRLTETHPDIVLVGRDRGFNYTKLAQAARAVAEGARLYLTNPDTSHRGPAGEPVPEAGALAQAIVSVAGGVPIDVVGKPQPLLFELGCGRLGLDPGRVAVIGDNPDTDGAGAARLGMTFFEVKPGDLGPGLLAGELETI